MLLLTRNTGESIIIGDDIQVVLFEIKNDKKARIGIIAPNNIPVHRQEIYERIHNIKYKGFKKRNAMNDKYLQERVVP